MKRGYNGELLANARSLRKARTPWERKLWFLFLRTYPVKVYRQRIIGNYIVDFYCPSAKLVIELDGSQHFDRERAPDEARRTARLQEYGCTVLRFPNIDIDRAFRAVCETIDREIRTLTQQSNRQEAVL